NNRTNLPGLIRMSFGLYNTTEDVDRFIEALKAVSAGEYQGEYVQDPASGEFHPKGWQPEFENFYSLA
ncbi:MAG: aminotransferase, partial [Anaerolineales bacterium]